MATFLSSARWTAEPPPIYLTGEYQTAERTSTTVKVRLKLTVSAVSGLHYFGYNIKARPMLAGRYVADWVTIKGNTPNQWSSPYVVYFPSASGWYTVNQAAANTSMTCTIYMDSNSGKRTANYSGTVSFPVGNTAPYWSGAAARFGAAGVVAENVSSLPYSWDAARDNQGDTIYYKVERYCGNRLVNVPQAETTGRSFSLDPRSGVAPGQSQHFRVYCRDYGTGFPSNSYIRSNDITRNALTLATLSGGSRIGFDTTAISLSRSNASNLNGNTAFTYTLSCAQVTVYQGSVSALGTTVPVSIWRSGATPSGPYIRFGDIQNAFRNSKFNGKLTFSLTTQNAYGSSGSKACNVEVDLRKAPSVPSKPAVGGAYIIDGVSYYVINRKPLALTWGGSTDPNGTAVRYTVQTSIDGGAWSNATAGITTTAYSYPVRSITSRQKVKFRVIAVTEYDVSSEPGPETAEYDLDFYNPPVMSEFKLDRGVDSCTVSWTYAQNTSLSHEVYAAEFLLFNTTTGLDLGSVATTGGKKAYTVSSKLTGLLESDTFTLNITCADSVATRTFSLNAPQINVVVSRYSALLTVREKGVGINAVAGDFADFIAKGTTSLYGGEPVGTADGSVNLAAGLSSCINFYSGVYCDAEGNLRAAQDLAERQNVYQLQMRPGNADSAPMRWRSMYAVSKVAKDAVFTPNPNFTSVWHSPYTASGGVISGSVIPGSNNLYSLGSATQRFANVFGNSGNFSQLNVAGNAVWHSGLVKSISISGTNGIVVNIDRVGNTVQVSIYSRMNQLPAVSRWDARAFATIPIGYRPVKSYRGIPVTDGENADWTKNYQYVIGTNGSMEMVGRTNALNWTGYSNGHGFWISATYITLDAFPS